MTRVLPYLYLALRSVGVTEELATKAAAEVIANRADLRERGVDVGEVEATFLVDYRRRLPPHERTILRLREALERRSAHDVFIGPDLTVGEVRTALVMAATAMAAMSDPE